MKTMMRLLAGALLLSGTPVPAAQPDVTWQTDFAAALKQAGDSGRVLLVAFEGRDWCTWCKRLDAEVFQSDVFAKYAKDNLVLFLADFPSQTKLPEELAKQNQALAEKYGVRGFPTVLLVDRDGSLVARTGYRPGGAEKYVEHLQQLLQKVK